MASHNVLIRVFDHSGRAIKGARVRVWVYQFAASGSLPEQVTDDAGGAEFSLDVDTYAEIAISVNGSEKVSRGSIKGSYRLEV